jgi:hypothetical protein
MQIYAPAEEVMWEKPTREPKPGLSDDEISAKYSSRELRIVTEANREQLPNFVEALKRPGWMELRPFYQRRPRWDPIRQSRLIESFIMNIPVPPLFVYESDFAKYEVMDGQQRITAIKDFYTNKVKLKGLEQWPELNGRIYETLPSEIRKGLDRRSISYIVLLKESASTTEEEALLRQQVFERLNTGGIALSHQEIRNSLYHSRFNTMLLSVVKHPIFRQAWELPPYSSSEDSYLPPELASKRVYTMMRDVEIALRFFALRHVAHYQRGMKGFLDIYMLRARAFTDADTQFLEMLFKRTLDTAWEIYGELIFKPWTKEPGGWADKPQVAFADAVMVGISRELENGALLANKRNEVIEKTKDLFEKYPPGTFTGQKNTKADVQERLDFYHQMLKDIIGE